MKVYKAQWPLAATGKVQVLIYEADKRDATWYYLDATAEIREQLFADKYVRVFFRGSVEGKTVNVNKFVRRSEWL
jgi:glucan-binding YG repeat protein